MVPDMFDHSSFIVCNFTGTLIAQLTADDPDGDAVTFDLVTSVNDFPDIAAELHLEKNGL